MSRNVLIIILGLAWMGAFPQDVKFNQPGAGNPIIPGYFADPTVRKFGDTYYIYSTTDGTGLGIGPSQVWKSKDFVNWTIEPMNWPTANQVWAPDVMQAPDGKYYFYYSQACKIFCAVSESPTGPWTNILGADEAVLVPDRYVQMAITLDAQSFIDDDGSIYLYWGTWGIYKNHGCGVGKLNPDMKTFADTTLIPNTQAIDFFEAPYVFKRDGIYYLTYSSGSCHDHTYRVQYATSKVGPMGPFDFADNNPILETSTDGTIHGPGHHSILKEGNDYYIVYHRHNIPQSTRGFFRQICVDKLDFDKDGRIKKVDAGHKGIGYLQKDTNPYDNIAKGANVRASSYYNENFKPQYALDDNNATLWKAAGTGEEWLEIDLLKPQNVRRIWTQFEYATSFYQYYYETSVDGKHWEIFSDKTNNVFAGSPLIDNGNKIARYIRLTITANEKNGLFPAVWNIKVFSDGENCFENNTSFFNHQKQSAASKRNGLIFSIKADKYEEGSLVGKIRNEIDTTQVFNAFGMAVPVEVHKGKKAFGFDGYQQFISNFGLPETMEGNPPYTFSAWILSENPKENECILDINSAYGEIEKIIIGYGTSERSGITMHHGWYEDMGLSSNDLKKDWTHLVVTFDGYMEKIYVNGEFVKEKDIFLLVKKSDKMYLGTKFDGQHAFSGKLHSLDFYDIPLSSEQVKNLFANESDYPISPVAFTKVKLTDNFWAPRIQINQDITIPIALKQCYITGRVDNFKKAGGLMPGYFDTQFTFDDTDIYKILEGMSYSVQMYPNKELDAQMDTLIHYIREAQEPDGYLFTARTAAKPGHMHEWVGEKRWEKDPELSHELYNSGHLFEAAVAHYLATGKRSLLDVAIKNADLLVENFGPGKLAYEPGHQIVEMGLVKLYRVTGTKEYLDLAKYFLDLRGHGKSGEYSQTHKPVIEQDEAVGHAVRAAYMYSGMADVAALTGNESYLHAIDKIWNNVVTKKYYITGGIGATGHGEAFGKNYELPNMSAYCETCAAIANVYWNHRLFLLHGDSKYYDVLERTLYNGLLSGISLSGDRFFYPNPLESVGQHARSEWFGCACCPSNICRFMPSVPGYVYAQKEDSVYVNLFVESNAELTVKETEVGISQKTNYPWEGDVSIRINPEKPAKFTLMIRIPGWLTDPVPSNLYHYLDDDKTMPEIKINEKPANARRGSKGYVAISREWKKGDKIDVSLPMDVRRVIANEKVEADRGKVSLERGPIVYCLEWPDNNDRVLNAVLSDQTPVESRYVNNKLNGIVQLEADAQSTRRDEKNNIVVENKRLTAIPYYAWANRGEGEMAVWIPRTIEKTRPLPMQTISTDAKVTALTSNKSLGAVNDGFWPENSNDRDVPFFSLWPKNNSMEWIEYEFDKAETVSSASVYWYDDGPWGGCRIPLSWNVQYKTDAGGWENISQKNEMKSVKDKINTVEFAPVTTKSIRLQFMLPEKESVGIYEFEVK